DAGTVNPKETCVLMGMGCDPEVARYGARWRLKDWATRLGLDKSQLQTLQDEIVPVLESPGVLGTMPNIVANRLSSQFDFTSFGFAISSEELSGVRSLEVAMRALRSGEVNTAVVGAVDVSAEKVHAAALKGLGHDTRLADGAVTLVLERLDDAQKAGRKIYAILEDDQPDAADFDSRSILERVGKPHAASGLLEISAAILALVENHHDGSLLRVSSSALGGQHTALCVRRPEQSRTIEPLSHSNEPTLSFSAHLPDFRFPDLKIQEYTMTQPSHEESLLPLQPNLHAEYVMQPAPELAAVMPAQPKQEVLATPVPVPAQPVHTASVPVVTPVAVHASSMAMQGQPAASSNPFVRAHQNLANAHARFLNEQARIQAQMMNLQNQARHYLMQRGTPVLQQRPLAIPAPAVQTRIVQTAPAPSAVTPKVAPIVIPAPQPVPETVVATPVMTLKQEAPVALEAPTPTSDNLPGLKLNREELMIHADGKISEIFGPMFEKQDGFHRQVRMPKPPLLLADRITGLDAEAGSMKNGTIWSETDVTEDAWYMHEGRMPAGIMIESGQADLMLISYLGIDFLNQSDRVYRLLGCELTYHGNLPQPGETLQYDIHVDGHAKQGDVRLFFFHYDCKVNGEPRLTVRGGQAGFFTDKELDDSKGIIWDAETGEYAHDARVDAPLLTCEKTSLTREELESYAAGRPQDCFGNGFEMGCTHTASPKIAGGRMLFMDKVTHLENQGGPWKRGYLRGTQKISSDDWFFDGHFKNDSCMPGTLMFEGCLQAMAVYLGSLGYTTGRDGWRFEPVPEETYKLQCRGQVLPTSKELIYEIFVEEVWDGPVPTLFADILCTVDGLKAFHCHRMGLRLVPDWPLEKIAALNPASDDSIPVATVDGFKFDYASLLACAWGKPSKAFGEMYTVFDQTNRVARLPGPPYHFMSRIPTVDGPIGGMKAGTVVEVDYDIPEDVWYFDENGHRTMPFCVLLEAALQPCGWLASYVGSALTSNDELFFRNLDGKGTLKVELLPAGGTLRTRSKITSISQSAGMIIESFEVKCFVDDVEVYEMNTVFGFFPHGALATQKGLDTSAEQFALLTNPSDFHVNLKEKPARYLDGTCRLANDGSLMLDRITGAWPEGGEKGLGRYRSEKDIDQDEWFFKAHFFQDPVQPGSLGIEAMIQLLQVAMLEQGMDAGIESPRFEPIALDKELSWKYRGQVRPHNKLVQVTLDITEKGLDARGPYAIADASLWVDGMRIYSADNIGMRIVNDGVARLKKKEVETLDPEQDTWLNDHCPTWTMPVLPMMSMVDRMAAAAASKSGLNVISMQDVMVKRWVPITKPTELRTEAKLSGDSVFVKLFEQDDVIATAKAVVGAYSAAPKPFEALAGAKVTSPYEEGSLFHGPAFQLLDEWVLTDKGSSAILNLDATDAPSGHLGQILLDAATHGIVHDNLNLWSKDIPNDQVAYPAWISNLTIHGPKPTQGKVRCETRFDGFVGGKRFPAFVVQLIADGEVWLSFKLVEALFPKGPLGSVSPEARAHFLRDRQYVDGVGLSSTKNSKTILRVADVHESDWLAGTVKAIYNTDDHEQIALKDHLAAKTKIHPGNLPEALPLSSWDYNIEKSAEQIVVSSDGGENLDLSCVKDFWSSWFNRGSWPVEDLFYSLANKFVRRVVLEEPAAMQALKGKSVLYLANHQVGIESLLFSIMASGMFKVPTVTLAKAEHRDTWLGHLIRDAFSYPGIKDPEVIAFFDREDKESLPRIIGELAKEMMGPGKSVMVHVEGTRSLSCTTPVEKMSGAFIDMALKIGVPIVPVRFSGGLPREDLEERIEFPLNMGQQDYHFGKPIMPEELASMPYGERKKLVMAAINGLGVPSQEEVTLAGDSSFHANVSEWSLNSGVSEDDAVLLQCLLAEPQVSEETGLILHSLNTGKLKVPRGKKGTWLKALAKRLLGSRTA
ncbi:MAG: 3-hydroxyacyl-[acyl-carrier-protein] dehydratase FabA, partial [Deltaproteobacteria bacterium]|nr:3-hydroxyacyl-[acyl-carrier-protein] dehydratase FabA [Deltaproteobacteria bacterium]